MFCDLVDSTERAQRLELEEWRDLVRSFQSVCYQEISRAGGFVAQYLGDGVLAYFGYPSAHGQDARAAVAAAIEIARGLREPSAPAPAARLQVRVGIDSGVVLPARWASAPAASRWWSAACPTAPRVSRRRRSPTPW